MFAVPDMSGFIFPLGYFSESYIKSSCDSNQCTGHYWPFVVNAAIRVIGHFLADAANLFGWRYWLFSCG